MGWAVSDIPSQQGRSALVTGTGGLGYETALALAQAGAEVILAGRNAAKGAAAVAQIRAAAPDAKIGFEAVDLASLASIADFAGRLVQSRTSLDLLINNAGVMAPPARQTTADGFELQFGTNHLAHFALTGRLLPLLRKGAAPRVVSVTSLVHRGATIDFDDLQAERAHRPFAAYGQSKLAQMMFALELQRRSDEAGWGLLSNAAHPGFASTDLFVNGQGAASLLNAVSKRFIVPLMGQPAAAGALPTLFAATSPAAAGGGRRRALWPRRLPGDEGAAQARRGRAGGKPGGRRRPPVARVGGPDPDRVRLGLRGGPRLVIFAAGS